MDELQFTKIDPPERKRTYIFPTKRLEFWGVTAICVRPSGNHRLETADGKKHIVNSNWLAIELDIDAWTF